MGFAIGTTFGLGARSAFQTSHVACTREPGKRRTTRASEIAKRRDEPLVGGSNLTRGVPPIPSSRAAPAAREWLRKAASCRLDRGTGPALAEHGPRYRCDGFCRAIANG